MTSIRLVTREQWGADSPELGIPDLKLPVSNVYFTFTGTKQCSSNSKELEACIPMVKKMQQEAMYECEMKDIPYNFLLGGDGCVYEGRGWRKKPEDIPEEPELNAKDTLLVAYIGDKDEKKPKYRQKFLEDQEDTFVNYAIDKGYIVDEAEAYYSETPYVLKHKYEDEDEDEDDDDGCGDGDVDGDENFDDDGGDGDDYGVNLEGGD